MLCNIGHDDFRVCRCARDIINYRAPYEFCTRDARRVHTAGHRDNRYHAVSATRRISFHNDLLRTITTIAGRKGVVSETERERERVEPRWRERESERGGI